MCAFKHLEVDVEVAVVKRRPRMNAFESAQHVGERVYRFVKTAVDPTSSANDCVEQKYESVLSKRAVL